MVPPWFEPSTTREEADAKLKTQNTGNFLVRQSSQPGTLALSVKIGGLEVKHFIIVSRDGAVALEDSDQDFDSLVALVSHYSFHSEELPVCLKLNKQNRKTSAPVLARGDSPYVSMADRKRTKSTIWVNSPVFRESALFESSRSRDMEVIKSVLNQGSQLQDSFSSILNDALKAEYVKRGEAAPKERKEDGRIEKNGDEKREEKKAEERKEELLEEEEYSLPLDEEDQLYEIPEVLPTVQDRLRPEPNKTTDPITTKPIGKVPEHDIRSVPDTVPGNMFRARKKNSVAANLYPPRFQTPPQKIAASKSCSNIFEELQQQQNNQQTRKKSFVRKISLNMSIRRNNIQPIRKLSGVMKKLLPIHKTFSSLVNSQENSDSWEFLPDCGISPVYEEIPERKMSDPILQNSNLSRLSKRSGSCDSVYESEFSSTNSSMDRGDISRGDISRGDISRGDNVRKPANKQKQYEKRERLEGGKEKGEGVMEKGVKEKCVTRIMLNAPSQSQIRRERDPSSTVYYV